MKRLVVFLIRKRFGVKKLQQFRFINQRSQYDTYYFTSTKLLKIEGITVRESGVSLNWLLNDDCTIRIIK